MWNGHATYELFASGAQYIETTAKRSRSGAATAASTIVVTIVACVMVISRIGTRIFIAHCFGIEDIFICCSFVSPAEMQAVGIVLIERSVSPLLSASSLLSCVSVTGANFVEIASRSADHTNSVGRSGPA